MFVSIFAAALVAATIPEASADAPILDLGELRARVAEQNPDLVAFDEERQAALERAVAASAMPNPSVGFALSNVPIDSFSLNEDMMTMKEVMVRQRFPFFGKRGLQREVAGQEAEVLASDRAAFRLALTQTTTEAYANLWLAAASRKIVLEQKKNLERFARLARGRYASGGGSQADLLRADVELAQIWDPLREWEEIEFSARAALAALLSVDGIEGRAELPSLPELPDLATLAESIDRHPEVRALAERKEQARLQERLADKQRWPDPEVTLMYGQRNNAPDMVGIELMFELPIFAGSKQGKEAAAARSDARALDHRSRARRDQLLAEARSAHAAAQRQQALIELYDESVIPRAERNLVSATGAYQAGGVDFLTLLDAEVQLQGRRLEALRARASYVREIARLERALGVNLFDFSGGTGPEGNDDA